MQQFRSYAEVARLAAKALSQGASHVDNHLHVIEWDVGAFCDAPTRLDVVGRDHPKGKNLYLAKSHKVVNPRTISVRLSGLPCRKCEKCLKVRAWHWRDRALAEMGRSERTWFCTFTFNPHLQHEMFMRELAHKNARGWRDGDFDEAGEFRLRCEGGFKLLTKYWKRVRKPWSGEEPVRLKYLVVAERHVSGLPHFHALVHEAAGEVTYRRLSERWLEHGFFHGKLVHDSQQKHARYVTKYIAKDMLCRVRASQKYGLDINVRPGLEALLAD